jgi:AraC-like DNA-binding protein
LKQPTVIFPGEKLSYLKTANPTKALSSYINFYYEIYFSNQGEEVWHTSLPSLNTLICINLDGAGWSYLDDFNDEQIVTSSTFVGHTLETRKFRHPRGMHNFFVNLKPGLAGLLLSPRQRELEDTLIDLNYLFKDLFLEEQLCEASNFHERIKLFEKLLLPELCKLEANYKYHTVQDGLELLLQQQSLDTTNLEDISRELAVSYSTLYRYFKDITDYSPKFCQKLDKFKKGLEQYKKHGYNFNHWEYGFTDFSHFVKVSKQLTNRTPSDL